MELRRIGGRLVIAVVIALIGLFVYFTQVEENPVTGAKQHVALSPPQEIQLGLRAAPQMARQMGGEIPSSDPRRQVVEKLGAHLLNSSLGKKAPWQFQFHLLQDDQTVNAFALPGGQIFITLGLLNKLSTEAELAGVLGHEIGHVVERHTAEQMAKNNLGQTMVIAVGTAASERTQTGYAIAALVNHMLQLQYGRKDELEADVWGLKLMEESRYNAKSMIKVMEVLKSASRNSGQLDIFQTHPNPDRRIKDIEEYLLNTSAKGQVTDGHKLSDLYLNPSLIGKDININQ